MIIALWVINALLALAFIAAGASKLFQPRTVLVESMGWAQDFGDGAVKGIGAVEVLGAFGLILPLVTQIAPILTPVAAVGLAAAMFMASIVHLRRKEKPTPSAVLMVLSIVSAVLGFLVVT